MEKIFLKPTAREILLKANESNVFFDSFEYGPRDDKDKHLGHLYVVGHLKFGEENMAYVLNLVSSLAKREYYSENGSIPEDPKKAFELTLKKLNDVLEDFFEKKDLKINLGLLAIAGENIYISKLGKLKVLLARSGEMIDILNNVDLFQKEQTDEKKFSNIVSGKIKEGDKLFALYPTRQTTAQEKNIKKFLAEKNQDEFTAELASIHSSSKNFPCCGFHIEVKKVKENDISIRSVYRPDAEVALLVEKSTPEIVGGPNEDKQTTSGLEDLNKQDNFGIGTINSAEMSITKRGNIFSKISQKLSSRRSPKSFQSKKTWKIGLAVLVVLVAGFTISKFSLFSQNGQKSALTAANENIKLAEVKVTQNDNKAARELLALSLSSITGLQETDKKVQEIKTKINTLLDKIDLASSKKAEPFFTGTSQVISKISVAGPDTITAVNQDHKILKISNTGTSEVTAVPGPDAKFVFQAGNLFSVYNGLDQLGTLNLDSKKYSLYNLKGAVAAKDAVLYEGNLYVLAENAIYKYLDAQTGVGKKQLWLGGLTDPSKLSIAVDGNVFVLSSNGVVVKYFKGKEESRLNFNLKLTDEAKLLTNKNSVYLYVVDYAEKKIRVFDKTNGSLILTYKVSQLPLLKDVALGENALYLLTIDSQIWKIGLQ